MLRVLLRSSVAWAVAALLAAPCVTAATTVVRSGASSQPPGASPPEQRVLGGTTDYSLVTPRRAVPGELPTWKIPNIPPSAEAYYAPDSYHIIAQTQDPAARRDTGGQSTRGALTWIYSDDGKYRWRVNDSGQDACSYFFPDGRQVVFTSTRDHPELPIGNWSNEKDYPQGAELYVSALDGSNLRRLTSNAYYEAEVSVAPDGQHIVFTRQVDGALDLYVARPDGTQERRITATPDWQEGAPFFLPDSATITTRAWSRAQYGLKHPTPMTIWTIETQTGARVQQTHDEWMNWAPYPAPDGRHYVFVRPLQENPKNWEVFLGELGGAEPVRLTFNESFDGFPALSPDGTKLIFSRSEGPGFMSGLYTYVMDVSSLGLGPRPGAVP